MITLKSLAREVEALKERNRRVESGKAWEISYTRKMILMCLTYLAIGVYMWAVGIDRPWLNAIVPAVAFMLSTLTLPWFKKLWLKYFY